MCVCIAAWMNFSVKPNETAQQPLAEAGGIPAAHPPVKDPFAQLEDLMIVIEALCPKWPARPIFTDTGHWLL
jgi:hypothetical protein